MWSNPQETADLVTFTEEIPNEKLHVLCSVRLYQQNKSSASKVKFSNFCKRVLEAAKLVHAN